MPTTTATTVTTTTALIAATAALALGAAGPATAAGSKKCGNVATRNGGKAMYIYAKKITCRSARTIAKGANGKTYKSSGFTCRPIAGLYGCFKPGTSKSVGFAYHKPS
ncbi:MAG TPA: hypothetical protein VNT55_07125 [Baekduia sp.]|nr:hypothetical protein [Baekduia sp.]